MNFQKNGLSGIENISSINKRNILLQRRKHLWKDCEWGIQAAAATIMEVIVLEALLTNTGLQVILHILVNSN